MEKTVNALGLACPLPVVETKKALESMTEAGTITVLVDNEIAVQNVSRFAGSRQLEAKSEKTGEKEFRIVIDVPADKLGAGAADAPADDAEPVCVMDGRRKGMVVAIGSNQMGNGAEKLGKSLMKAFVFALTKQDYLPETILFFNSGAYLTCEGSDSLEDIKELEAQGVEIMTCGTCLDFYELKEKLAVGSVTNMYVIVEKMEKASLVIKP
ncbi:MAG: sulfurtransferase-like selenium metabolism protein YedF [Lachnospiraceae bacterium]|nr:sulfurtransferase-like selenium metabolism protein YedF [Lachnospiraceae bacterium]MDY4970956.1 sulfurtransferase-like selenium metabolism protein YedF [Lachnospiraceae bacterium]